MSSLTLELAQQIGGVASAEFPRVIRRDLPQSILHKPRVVPWLGHKIAKAVDAACSSVDHVTVGEQVRTEVEIRIRREHTLFVHIEELQDLVENTLIELGHGRVALAYGKYRARRAALREVEAATAGSGAQLELSPPGVNADLRARLSFARIGLDLRLSEDELMARLLRGISMSLTPQEHRETVILNAKNLLYVDGDCRFLAGRILLTYIYEETLPWKVEDGIDQLKESHRKAFLSYIPLGIEAKRLDRRLAEFRLKELADAIDPYADLQFDFIGIQNLYDRYLIHVKDSSVADGRRRIEAPQIFWMRVAMGLSILEQDREARARSSTGSIRASSPVLLRRRYSMPVPFTPNCPAVTCSIVVIRWRRLQRPGLDFRCYQSGRGDWVVPGRRCAAAARIFKGPMGNRPGLFLFSRFLTTSRSR